MNFPKSCGEPGRRLRAGLAEAVLHQLRFQTVVDRGVELVDDVRRRAGRNDDAGPERGDVIRMPLSAMVGTSGSCGCRAALVTASALTFFSWISGSRIEISGNVICTWLLNTAVTISAPLL
jgi:hypothetical protein